MSLPFQSPGTPVLSVYRDAPSTTDAALALEAAAWLDAEVRDGPIPPLLIVIGLDEGHLLGTLAQRSPDTRVLALEPDAAKARAFLTNAGRPEWRSSGRLTYLTGPAYQGAADAWRLFPATGDGFALLTHPRLRQNEQVARAAQTVKKIVFGVRANAEARRRFAPRYLRNVIRNVPGIVKGRDVRALSQRFTGMPAVITAAGPSLDGALTDLRMFQDHALLIATDTTLRPLLSAGISPHLAVGADPGAANARHFQALPDGHSTWLVCESALEARAAAAFGDRTLWFRLANHHPWPWLQQQGIEVGHLEMWGSVLTAAFQLACLAGCDPIVITGADLAFTGERPYCRGTTYEFDWAYWAGTGQSLQDTWGTQMARSQMRRVPDVHGAPTTSTPALLSFRDWMLARARRSGRRVVNATGAGMLYGDGIEQQPLASVLTRSTTIPSMDSVVMGMPAVGGHPAVSSALDGIRRALDAGSRLPPPLDDWASFSGDGFDGAALHEALTAACTAMDRNPQDSAAATATPAFGTAPAGYLAESTARLAAALRGEGDLAGDSSHPGPMTLVESLASMRSICEEVLTHASVQPSEHASQLRTAAPVAVRYAWTEPLRWAIQQLEGQLGAAWRLQADVRSMDGIEHEPIDSRSGSDICLQLVLEWARCAASHVSCSDSRESGEWHRAIEGLASLRCATPSALTDRRPKAMLNVEARSDQRTASLAVPLDRGVEVGASWTARAATLIVSLTVHPAVPAGKTRV